MKVLIVAPSRTGGRILNRWISHELNLLNIHEPFHFHKESFIKTIDELIENLNKDNISVKVNYGDWKNLFEDEAFFSLFDKIICLTRDNVYDASISYTKALETSNFTKVYEINEEWINNNKNEIEKNYTYLNKKMKMTKEIKNTLQVTYEGVYYKKTDIKLICEYINIHEMNYLNFLDIKNRYRNNKAKLI